MYVCVNSAVRFKIVEDKFVYGEGFMSQDTGLNCATFVKTDGKAAQVIT